MENVDGAKILLIDDDDSLPMVLEIALVQAGYKVQRARNGLEGLQYLYRWRPDLVVLDVTMPRMDGWETCGRIREVSDVLILMLTAKAGAENELKGLKGGADQYVTKPFLVSVLLARIEALLRRSRHSPEAAKPATVAVGDLKIDLARQEVSVEDRSVDLSPTEFRLLAALASRPNEVIPHQQLLTEVWGPEYAGESFYLKMYVRYLRQKIEDDPAHPRRIITRRGVGYYLNGSGAARPLRPADIED